MREDTIKVKSKVDGLELEVYTAEPDGGPTQGIFQLVHGMAEMKERYHDFIKYLTGFGFACIIHDHRGHGQSVKSKDDLGYFYGGGGDAIVEDTHQITEVAKLRWPGMPVVLFGHSMGSLVVRCYLQKYDGELEGLIVSGSPSKNPVLGMGKAIVGVQKAFHGDRYKSPQVNKMAFSGYLKNIENPQSDFAWLSVNPDNVAAYEKSEYCGFPFTLDGFKGLFDLMGTTYGSKGWGVRNPKLPILFISGKEDPCIGSAQNFKFAVDHMRSLGYSNIRGKMYDGMRHEILNETNHQMVYDDICKWMKQSGLMK